MKLRSALLISISSLFLTYPSSAQDWDSDWEEEDIIQTRFVSTHSDRELEAIFQSHYLSNMRHFPEWATYEGLHQYDDRLTDMSLPAIQQRHRETQTRLAQLLAINTERLSQANQLNYTLFKAMLEDEIESHKYGEYLQPLGQQHGIHIGFPQIINSQPLNTIQEFSRYFKRLRAFPQQVSQVIANMRRGKEAYLMPPQFIMMQVLEQIDNILNQPISESPFYLPITRPNLKLSSIEKDWATQQLKHHLKQDIYPAYRRLAHFIRRDYLPACRTEAGIWNLPNGLVRYQHFIQRYTTLDMHPEEIHQLGLKEVKRLRQEMEKVKNQIGFQGDLDAFHDYLKSDSRFYYQDSQELMADYQKILDQIQSKLPELFQTLPQAPVALKEMEPYRARSAPQAYYYPAPQDRSRPGYFYVNTYDLKSRPKHTMTALTLHEAVPGHHLQIALAQEQPNLPKFRRDLNATAFVEGWALYAESLGYSTGMYEDLYQKYGALTFEIWRACRLVVDTGIHAKKWTRQEAYEFMRKYTPNSDLDIRSEIDRYISWPGQALAYKLGELKIKALRQEAQEALGADFNLKSFHQAILENGPLPLNTLEAQIEQWLDNQE